MRFYLKRRRNTALLEQGDNEMDWVNNLDGLPRTLGLRYEYRETGVFAKTAQIDSYIYQG